MADNNSEEEPSIEEILSSIREIISEEEGDDADSPEEETLASPIHEEREDVLELTEGDLVESEEPFEDLEPEPAPEPKHIPEPEPEPVMEEPEAPVEIEMQDRQEVDTSVEVDDVDAQDIIEQIRAQTAEEAKTMPSDILSSSAQTAALGSLNKLKTKMPINNPRSYDGVTLEDIVREALHPMLREWMDDNLPRMVERIVQKELEKLARRAMDD